ncbi:PEP-CTERM sorting domain-containing protein [Rubripirellula lacrimiformis]|uniref:PEP-CTERM sorting domain-containing protein n=1 Tax=Rubripirellula lacrimiformis TaxID=1930273 RepID=UPI0011A197AA|nr:PEP-CTERM sorting domain-containing protein [Rubripirellula lacrimiformis]
MIRNKLVSGSDVNGASLDGYVDVNWGYAWELDPNTPAVAPGAGQTFDFYAAMFHEFTHALGFGSEISGTPAADRFDEGSTESGTPGSWSKWDEFLTDKSGAKLIDPNTQIVDATAFANAQTDGGLFAGPNAFLAFGSQPNLFDDPDQSHLDEATFSMPTKDMNFMMKPNRDYGPQEARTWSSLEIGILTDLGYSRVSAVPEPSTFAVILVGILAVETRRRRRVQVAS